MLRQRPRQRSDVVRQRSDVARQQSDVARQQSDVARQRSDAARSFGDRTLSWSWFLFLLSWVWYLAGAAIAIAITREAGGNFAAGEGVPGYLYPALYVWTIAPLVASIVVGTLLAERTPARRSRACAGELGDDLPRHGLEKLRGVRGLTSALGTLVLDCTKCSQTHWVAGRAASPPGTGRIGTDASRRGGV